MIVVVVVTDASDITYPDRKSIPVKLSRLHRVCMHGNTESVVAVLLFD